MSLFSQRQGLTPSVKLVQLDDIDTDLKNQLWSALQISLWGRYRSPTSSQSLSTLSGIVVTVTKAIWTDYLKLPIDIMGSTNPKARNAAILTIRKLFFESEWYWIYDLIEFILKAMPEKSRGFFAADINRVLESENSGYRFVGESIMPISDKVELDAVVASLETEIVSAREHILRAIQLFSDKQNPDYRNVVKEAISAVESMVKHVTGLENATLHQALNKFDEFGVLHPAFKSGMSKIYGYTSDAGGIRHSLNEQDRDVTLSEAKFMIVLASGFINYAVGTTLE